MFKVFYVWLFINCNVCGGVMIMVNMCINNCYFLKILIKKKVLVYVILFWNLLIKKKLCVVFLVKMIIV